MLLTLPKKTSEILYVSENNKINITRFNFQPENKENYQVDISLLSMNNEYTQVNLHVGYCDGHVFSNKSSIKQAAMQFEYSIHATLKGDLAFFQPVIKEEQNSISLLPIFEMIAGYVSNLFLIKKI
jgi:hypothetical protein